MLETWDAQGVPIIGASTRLFKRIGVLRIGHAFTGEESVGTIFDQRFALGDPQVIRLDTGLDPFDAVVTVKGRILTWRFVEPVRWRNGVLVTRPSARFAYGIQ